LRLLLLPATALLAFVTTPVASAAPASNPCAAHPSQPGWRIFTDHKAGFCLEYPSDYERMSTTVDGKRCRVAQGCLLSLEKKGSASVPRSEDDDDKDATIDLWDLRIPFQLKLLKGYGPTGYEDPPEPVQFGSNTIYYFGRGGGGVNYADQFFFAVRGRAFGIYFVGPYMEGNEPDAVTKDIEARMLRSLRRF